MQMAVPEVMDISKESTKTLEAYGAKPGGASLYAVAGKETNRTGCEVRATL